MVSYREIKKCASLNDFMDKKTGLEKHVLSECQEKVLKTLEKPMNNRMIAESLEWSINRVTPRILELREAKLVELSHKGLDEKTKRTTNYWKRCKQ